LLLSATIAIAIPLPTTTIISAAITIGLLSVRGGTEITLALFFMPFLFIVQKI
jgi:uncharacterized membrane protein